MVHILLGEKMVKLRNNVKLGPGTTACAPCTTCFY
uniref:Uncharacterized protein n=1 Tax=Anguilla anguilla TaxID=7936 RepID=A0A0E9P9B4_ANGAN